MGGKGRKSGAERGALVDSPYVCYVAFPVSTAWCVFRNSAVLCRVVSFLVLVLVLVLLVLAVWWSAVSCGLLRFSRCSLV